MKNINDNRCDISIVIPNYNSTDFLLRCLDSIYKQKTNCAYEVIVVDSSDNDPTDRINQDFPDVRVVHVDGRMYPGTARNKGVKISRGDIIAFTDADCIVSDNWINNILQAHEHEEKVVGGAIINGYYKHLIATAEFFSEFGEFLPTREPGPTSMLPSCNFTIKKALFERVGGFKDFITAEDVLFSDELRKAGIEIYFNPKIAITHYNRRKISVYLLKQKELGIGSYFLRKKIDLTGSWLTRRRIYTGIIPLLRTVTIIKKTIQNDPRQCGKVILVYPFILMGLLAYSYGFWKAFKMAPMGE